MADIRVKDLPLATGGTAAAPTDVVAIDGLTTRRAPLSALADVIRPMASQAEAEAGVNAVKGMSPLLTAQAIDAQAASIAQGAKADSAMQPTVYDPLGVSGNAFALSNMQGTLATAQYADASVSLVKLAAPTVRATREFLKPSDFGVPSSPTGFTDYATQIQNCFNAATTDGYSVLIDAGQYGIGTELIAPANLNLIAHAQAELRRVGTAGGLMNNYAPGATVPNRTANGNIRVSGGIWNGRGSVLGGNSIFNFAQATNILFENATITDCAGGHHFEINGVKNATLRNLTISLYTDTGGRDFSEAIQLDFMGSSAQLGGLNVASYDGTPCENITIENIVFSGVARAIGSHSWDNNSAHWIDGVTIQNILASGCTSDIMRPNGWRRFTIDNVIGLGAGNIGLRIEDCENFTVSNAKISNTTGRGIWVRRDQNSTMEKWLVRDSDFVTTGGAAIDAQGVSKGKVSKCRTNGSSSYGINADTCTDVDFDDNDISNTGTSSAIRVITCTRVKVRRGSVSGTYAPRGVDVQLGSNNIVEGVEVRDLAVTKAGILLSNSTVSATVRNNKISGSDGTGIGLTTAGVANSWIDGNDLRGMTAGTKISVGTSTGTIQTNNQV